jgi:hypothetical protein
MFSDLNTLSCAGYIEKGFVEAAAEVDEIANREVWERRG